MRLVQLHSSTGPCAALASGDHLVPLEPASSLYQLACEAIGRSEKLQSVVSRRKLGSPISYADAVSNRLILPPLTHPDPRRCLVSVTGLTHLGGMEARNQMHLAETGKGATDSVRMFRLGLEGGKPSPGRMGVQPEWCFKGDGELLVPPYGELASPSFALHMGEEPEIVALYVVGDSGVVFRVGFALGNEFTDHRMERINYLYLGHAKMRPCSIGPEILIADLPRSIEGHSRIVRDRTVVWEKPFLTGEDNMCHSLDNIEKHHFKYPWHQRPGDVHVHFLGTATISFADGFDVREGDVMEIAAAEFGHPLRNTAVRWRVKAPEIVAI